jgi:hypothetical protein
VAQPGVGVQPPQVGIAPPQLPATTTKAAPTTTTPVPATTTTTKAVHYNCDVEVPEEGDRVQATNDIIFRPTGMVPRSTYGSVRSVQQGLPNHEHAMTVTFEGFPHLENARVSLDQVTQAVERGDRVKAAKALGDGGTVPRDAVGTVSEVVAPGDDGWEFHYRVTWDGLSQDFLVSRDQIYKVDAWSPAKTTWCCHHEQVGCPENCATNETWSEEKTDWCCAHHGLGCGNITVPTSTTVTTRTKTTTSSTTPSLFNCYMQEEWTEEKQEWCCSHENLGCPPADEHGVGL